MLLYPEVGQLFIGLPSDFRFLYMSNSSFLAPSPYQYLQFLIRYQSLPHLV